MPFALQVPTELTPHFQEKYSVVEREFIEAIQTMNPASLEKSFASWNKLLTEVVSAQKLSTRFHKGGELQNMGACLLYTQQNLDALDYFIQAYIEDLLSLSAESANNTPASNTLKQIYKFTADDLDQIVSTLEEHIKKNGSVFDPSKPLDDIKISRYYSALETKAKKVSLFIHPESYYSISRIPGEFEKRVFIGGDYESIYLFDAMIRIVAEFGYIPIVASEFLTEEKDIHHHALLLLHNCKYAIFDVSSKGGHMMEAERTIDYGTTTLFVCKKTDQTRISAMLRSLGKGYDVHWFDSRWQLKLHIAEFLSIPVPSEGIEEHDIKYS